MTDSPEATSIRHEVTVDAPIVRAFAVFTEDFGRFKPREHNMLAVDIAETVFEPRAGGRLFDRGVDGSECTWARVLAYMSVITHFESFGRGVIDSKDAIYYVTVIFLGLFFTARSMESLRWRS